MLKNIKIKEGTLAEKVYSHLKQYGEITAKEALEKYGIKTFHQVIDYLKNDLKLPINKVKDGKSYKFYIGEKDNVEKTKKPVREVGENTITNQIINHIKKYGSINRQEAYDLYGIRHFSQRISYIKNMGYVMYQKKGGGKFNLTNYSFEENPVVTKPTPIESDESDALKFISWDKIPETMPEDMVVSKTLHSAVLNHLKKYGTINSKEANELYGTLQLPSIIHKLKKEGYNISRSGTRDFKFGNEKIDRNSACYTYTLEKRSVEKVKHYIVERIYSPKYELLLSDNTNGEFKTKKEALDSVIKEMNTIYQTLTGIIEPNPNDSFLLDFDKDGMVIRRRKFVGLFKRKMLLTNEIRLNVVKVTEIVEE